MKKKINPKKDLCKILFQELMDDLAKCKTAKAKEKCIKDAIVGAFDTGYSEGEEHGLTAGFEQGYDEGTWDAEEMHSMSCGSEND